MQLGFFFFVGSLRANELILLAVRSALSYGSGVVIIAENAKIVPNFFFK